MRSNGPIFAAVPSTSIPTLYSMKPRLLNASRTMCSDSVARLRLDLIVTAVAGHWLLSQKTWSTNFSP